MAEPATSKHQPLPPPYVYVQPRSRRPGEANRPTNEEGPEYGLEDRSPYPRWAILIIRGSLTAFGIAVLAYVASAKAKADSMGLRADAGGAIAGAALAIFFDGILALIAAVGAYEAGTSCTSGFLDVVPGVVCLVGAFMMAFPERHQEEEYDSYYAAREVAATLLIVLGVVHFLSSVSGCVGCCITSTRRGRAKREKRAIVAAVVAAREAIGPQPPAGGSVSASNALASVGVEQAEKMEPDAADHVENLAPGAKARNPDGSTAQKA